MAKERAARAKEREKERAAKDGEQIREIVGLQVHPHRRRLPMQPNDTRLEERKP